MPDFKFNITLTSVSETEAKETVTALLDIYKAAGAKDVKYFASKIKANPKLIAKAKMFI